MSSHQTLSPPPDPSAPRPGRVILFWLPLGAGGRSVRGSGRTFEALAAVRGHRPRADLYHSALKVECAGVRHVIEMTPAWGGPATDRGVVVTGPVGLRLLGRSVLFRYEVRRWADGEIPDLADAVGEPRVVSEDGARARLLLDQVPRVPALTWGRDEQRLGDMWNSNSLTAWLLATSGHPMADIRPPGGGRAPGWDAGLGLARVTGPGGRTRGQVLL